MNNEIENSQEEIRKCLNLWRAVISLSIQDFILLNSDDYIGRCRYTENKKKIEDWKRSRIYYIQKSTDFMEVCKLAGFNCNYIREKLSWMYNDKKVELVKNQLKGNNTRVLKTFLTYLYDYDYEL